MDLFNLWPMNTSGQETAEEAMRRREQRFDEPLPYPARKINQLAHGFIDPVMNINKPGQDPVLQGLELGMLAISPFRGAIATARPRITPQEELWRRAQQGDIQATGQLTGEMFQRELREEPPLMPRYPEEYRGPAPRDSLSDVNRLNTPNYNPNEMGLWDPLPPMYKEVHGDSYWNGERWVKGQPEGLRPPPELDPSRFKPVDDSYFNPGDRMGDKVWDGEKWIEEEPLNPDAWVPEPPDPLLPQGAPTGKDWDEIRRVWREQMDYLPPEGSVPPRAPGMNVDESGFVWDPQDFNVPPPPAGASYSEWLAHYNVPDHPTLREYWQKGLPPGGSAPEGLFEPAPVSDLDPTMGGAFPEGMSYDDWQEVLRRMNASPNVLPRINPFGRQ